MKITELQKLIREEVRKVMNEAKTWDKKAIKEFFNYLLNNHGIRSKPVFKTDTSGRVEIYRIIGASFNAEFMVDGNNLIFNPKLKSEMTAKDFVEDIENDGAEGYKFKIKNKSVIVS